jgi:hypothetical protein
LQGTWQFMAADLIEDPKICQMFVHDIESAFFLLLWMSICYIKSNWDESRRSDFINSIFHPPVYGHSGGSTKMMFMQSTKLDSLEFVTNKHLAALLRAWKKVLAFRYAKRPEKAPRVQEVDVRDVILRTHHKDGQSAESASQDEEDLKRQLLEYELLMSGLKNHNVFLEVLDEVLVREEWPLSEPAEWQSIIPSRSERQSSRLSSKRCREAAAESEGNTLAPPSLLKRNKSL